MLTQNDFDFLDKQMKQWETKLRDDVKILPQFVSSLASTISSEILILTDESKKCIIESTPIQIEKRLEELIAFQGWMDYAHTVQNNPHVIRAQIITEIYVCFVYLSESCFKIIRQETSSQSVTKKCCKFLTNNSIRAFRNAIAHGNWQYKPDFSGLEFWARKGQDNNEPMSRFEVSQENLAFWQSLARCVAYVSFLSLKQGS